MVGFDLGRSFTPAHAIGRANGLVDVGGFRAPLLTMALIGVVLDLSSSGGISCCTRFSATSARRWRCGPFFWALGVVQVLRYRRRGLAGLARVHPDRWNGWGRRNRSCTRGIGTRASRSRSGPTPVRRRVGSLTA